MKETAKNVSDGVKTILHKTKKAITSAPTPKQRTIKTSTEKPKPKPRTITEKTKPKPRTVKTTPKPSTEKPTPKPRKVKPTPKPCKLKKHEDFKFTDDGEVIFIDEDGSEFDLSKEKLTDDED